MAGPEKQRTKFNQGPKAVMVKSRKTGKVNPTKTRNIIESNQTLSSTMLNEGFGFSGSSPATLLGKAINRGVGAVASLTGNKRTARSIRHGIKAAKIKDKQGKLKYKTSWDNPTLKARGIHGIPAPFASELNTLYKKK